MVSVRTTRQKRVQSITTIAAITECTPVPRMATSRIESSTGGNAIQTSTSREISASTQPRRKPAKRPSSEPIRHARPAATKATVSEIRAPKITRESTSRPRPSVPSKNPASASGKPIGGNVAANRFCASGSCGAISGANTARTISNRMKPPATTTLGSPSRRRAVDGGFGSAGADDVVEVGDQCSTSPALRVPQARIERCHREICPDIDQDEDQSEQQDQTLDQREIAVDDRVDGEIADARIGEDALNDHRAADQEGELHAGERQRRADRVAQRLLQHQAQFAKALDPRQQHVILQHRLLQGLLEKPHDYGGERQRQRQRRHDHMAEDVAGHGEAAGEDAFNQIKTRSEAFGELRIDAAGQRQYRNGDGKEQNERQG